MITHCHCHCHHHLGKNRTTHQIFCMCKRLRTVFSVYFCRRIHWMIDQWSTQWNWLDKIFIKWTKAHSKVNVWASGRHVFDQIKYYLRRNSLTNRFSCWTNMLVSCTQLSSFNVFYCRFVCKIMFCDRSMLEIGLPLVMKNSHLISLFIFKTEITASYAFFLNTVFKTSVWFVRWLDFPPFLRDVVVFVVFESSL